MKEQRCVFVFSHINSENSSFAELLRHPMLLSVLVPAQVRVDMKVRIFPAREPRDL